MAESLSLTANIRKEKTQKVPFATRLNAVQKTGLYYYTILSNLTGMVSLLTGQTPALPHPRQYPVYEAGKFKSRGYIGELGTELRPRHSLRGNFIVDH